ncbi:MAG: hypothetical protein K6G81_04270 [Lachnospiraceae bacterium]|nr:hypothetical protein [Lachnospiraceae bacterium]
MVEKKGCLFSSVLMVIMAVIAAAGLLACTKGNGKGGSGDKNTGSAAAVEESWAYIHDKGTEILVLHKDGSAKYKGQDYTYTKGEDYLELTDKLGTVNRMKFVTERDHMLLYERLVYTFAGDGSPDGLIGLWKMGNQSFEFTDQGTFKEDEIFPGHYMVNEEEKSIRLAYNDHFVDAILYYQTEGNDLTIDYPMPVVPTQETDDEK